MSVANVGAMRLGASWGVLVVVDELELGSVAAWGDALEGDAAVEDLGFEERLHQFVVGAVAESLLFVVNGGGVFGGVGGAFFGQAPGEDLFGGPGVDGVGGGFDFEHAVGDVFRDALFGVPGAPGGAFELAELLAAFIDGHDPGLGIKVGLDQLVLVFAGDLADPSPRRGDER
jgi:hypothetical protein